jgi:hypothetical protein
MEVPFLPLLPHTHTLTLGLSSIGVYDITSFIYEHPGSPETLLDYSGRDGTVTFNEIGHSLVALSLKDSYLIYQPLYLTNFFKHLIHEMKKKLQLSYEKNPLQTMKAQNAAVLNSHTFNSRRTISVDVDDCEQRLVVVPETYFELKLNQEREVLHTQLAESHYREINYSAERKLFILERDDELRERLVFSQQRMRNLRMARGVGTEAEEEEEREQQTHVRCHEIARNNQPPPGGGGGTGLASVLWSVNYPKHPGQPREFYDPLSQEWWIWWSCCGCGRPVPRDLMP